MGARYTGSSWADADAFINDGRNKDDGRTAGNNRRLSRRANGDIDFVLHSTAIITYHAGDGMQTITTGGWNTMITKMDLNAHSNARVYSVYHHVNDAAGNDMKGELAIWHKSDHVSPPKIHKCRKCHGTAELRTVCKPHRGYGHYWADREWRDAVWAALPGMTSQEPETDLVWSEDHKLVHYPDGSLMHALTGKMLDVTKDREDRDHKVCDHGFFEPHYDYNPCYNCSGTGKVDHGGRQIPTLFGSRDRVLIHPDGRVWTPIEDWVAMIAGLRRTRRRNAS